MRRFSIKQLMGSMALVAVGISLLMLIPRANQYYGYELYELLIFLLAVPSFFAAFYNLSGRPWRGARIGLIAMLIALLALPLVWLMLRVL